MPKDYELTLVVDTQLSEEGGVDATVGRYEALIGERGSVLNIDRWGTRKMAYDVHKRNQGDYTFFQFQAEPSEIAEIDRACRLDDAVLRHLVITVEAGLAVEEAEEAVAEADSGSDDADAAPDDSGAEEADDQDESEKEENAA